MKFRKLLLPVALSLALAAITAGCSKGNEAATSAPGGTPPPGKMKPNSVPGGATAPAVKPVEGP
jgi:hypothetical protein